MGSHGLRAWIPAAWGPQNILLPRIQDTQRYIYIYKMLVLQQQYRSQVLTCVYGWIAKTGQVLPKSSSALYDPEGKSFQSCSVDPEL